MCVIAYSPKTVDLPSNQQIKAMWRANPDGAGFAYEDPKTHKILFKKGFMSLKNFLHAIEPLRTLGKNTNFVLHFRIATSGKVDQATTHPFPITDDIQEMRKLSGKVDAILFHNGIFGEGRLADKDSSDTQDFVVATAPLLKQPPASYATDAFLEEYVELHYSRVIVLYPNDTVRMYGKWEKDGGLFVSNTFYQQQHHIASLQDYVADPQVDEGDLADILWGESEAQGYIEVTPYDIKVLKKTADDYSEDQLQHQNKIFGYGNGYVWYESDGKLLEEDNEKEEEMFM